MSSSPQPPNAVHSLPEHSPRAHAHVGGNRRIAASRNRARSSSGASANNATAGGAERYTTQSPRLPRRSPRGAVGANSPRMLGRIQPTIPRKPRGVVDSGAVGPVRAACAVRHVLWCSQRPMLLYAVYAGKLLLRRRLLDWEAARVQTDDPSFVRIWNGLPVSTQGAGSVHR